MQQLYQTGLSSNGFSQNDLVVFYLVSMMLFVLLVTPHKPFAGGRGARNIKDRFSKSIPSNYKSNIGTSQQTKPKTGVSSTFDRTAQVY